jgi:mannose-6-phosphate isomerase-like protein (cupin superfamily)
MRIAKAWGWEEILIETDKYRIKRIHVNAGHRLSLQYHEEKVETWLNPDHPFEIMKHIPPGTIHRLEAPKDRDLDVLEVASGSDEDIVRLEDDYGRV